MARRRWIRLGLAVAVVSVAFSGCGKGEEQASSSPPETPSSLTTTPQRLSASDQWDKVPSGSLLFTTRRDMDNLYIVNSDGTGLKRLTSSAGRDLDAAFSPDGSLIAYASQFRGDRADGIYVVSSDGGRAAQLVAADNLWDWDPTWGSSGKILYEEGVEGYGTCWIVNADGSGHVAISGKEACDGAQWSPDAQEIAIVKCGPWGDDVGTKCSLSILDEEGELVQTLAEGSPISSFKWSPDGKQVLFEAGSPPTSISVINVDGTDPHTIQTPSDWRTGDRVGALSSPNGAESAHISSGDDGGLYVVASDGSERKVMDDPRIHACGWSPDGKQILFASDRGREEGVWWVSPDGSQKARLGEMPIQSPPQLAPIGGCKEGTDHFSCLSPDGRSEATAAPKEKSITIKDVSTGVTRTIRVDDLDIRSAPVWSNDGTKIAAYAGNWHGADRVDLYVVDVATGEARMIAADAGTGDTIVWSPDDSYIYYARSTLCVEGCNPGLLYRVHPDGTGDELVVDMIVDTVFGFKP